MAERSDAARNRAMIVDAARELVAEPGELKLSLVALAHSLLGECGPDVALERWFAQLAAYARVKLGVIAAVEASVWQDISAQTMGKLAEALTALLDAGRQQGVLRGDVDARDVILLSWFLAHVERDEWDERTPRLLSVLLDGLRVR